jgi:hypothetical protein
MLYPQKLPGINQTISHIRAFLFFLLPEVFSYLNPLACDIGKEPFL